MEGYQPLLVVLVAIVMGWFGGGVIWNLRRGNAVLKWMQAGLPLLGEKTTLRWLGSSAVELVIAKARSPFRRCELVLVMEPRDVPWLWLLSRSRGRRDMLIFRGQLNNAPRLEYEVLAPESWTGQSAASQAALALWGDEELDGYRFVAPKASLPVSRKNVPMILDSAHEVHPKLWRLSVRREFPQLEVHIPLPDPKSDDADKFIQALRSLAQRVSDSREVVTGDH